jgi:hypothetical protein
MTMVKLLMKLSIYRSYDLKLHLMLSYRYIKCNNLVRIPILYT